MKSKKVMILLEKHENIAADGINILGAKGYDLFTFKNYNHKSSTFKYAEYEALLVRGTSINRALIEKMHNLKIIARCGIGTDNIDIQAATDNNVLVCNVPDSNCISVAEYVIGMMISLARHINKSDHTLRNNNFNARQHYIGEVLKGKTVGIIGFGKIGQMVARKCSRGFDMKVLVFDPYIKNNISDEKVTLMRNRDDLLKKSDFVTLHLPFNPSLYHVINEETFKKMKKNSYIINCARGGLIDEGALVKAIKNGDISGAGIDVYEDEPPEVNHDLWRLENVVVTPHIAGSTSESLLSMTKGAAKEIVRVFEGKQPKNPLNK